MTLGRNLEAVLVAAENRATIVTSNSRASRFLRRAYDERQQHKPIWPTADILTWEQWLDRLLNQYVYRADATVPVLLSSEQEAIVWEQVIAEDRRNSGSTTALARIASEAWSLAHKYGIPFGGAEYQKRPDTAAFLRWSESFVRRCKKNEWLDGARLPEFIAGAIASAGLKLPATLIFWGFDKITHDQESVRAAVAERETKVVDIPSGEEHGAAVCLGRNDTREELQSAAAWARELLANGAKSIGVIVPSLNNCRAMAERIFLEALHPQQLTLHSAESRRAFDLSLGIPLARVPLVTAALTLLKLVAAPLPLEEASRLLRSPYLGEDSDFAREQRATFDLKLRRQNISQLAAWSLAKRRAMASTCRDLADAFAAMAKAEKEFAGLKQAPSVWADRLQRLLVACDCPGSRTLNSAEYQAQQAWNKLLVSFAELDLVLPSISYAEALQRIERMAESRLFQPENLGAPVQILGPLEAAGSQFEHLWVTGLHEEAWPPKATPNPLLPLSLQKCVEGGSPEEQLLYAVRTLDRLQGSAKDIVLSFPRTDGERDLRASALLPKQTAPVPDILTRKPATWVAALAASESAEMVVDSSAPPMKAGVVSGGTKLFKLQALCPFRAFAEIRLGSKAMDEVSDGFSPLERGEIVHVALQNVWRALKTQQALKQKSEPELDSLVQRCTEDAITSKLREDALPWELKLAELELERITKLVLKFLELEKQRATPFTVLDTELEMMASFGGLTTKIKVDRMDEVDDGKRIVLDYKTGTVNVKKWEGARPEEPQLPVYAASLADSVVGAAFISMKAGNIGYAGHAASSNLLPNVYAFDDGEGGTFSDLVKEWRSTLEKLAEDHRTGRADVDPKNGEDTCQRCHMKTLCRKAERYAVAGGIDEN